MSLLPEIIAILAAIAVLRLPLVAGACLAVFFAPFGKLVVDIGVGLRVFEFLSIVVLLKVFILRRSSLRVPTVFMWALSFLLFSSILGMFNLAFRDHFIFLPLADARGVDPQRVAVMFVKYSVLFLLAAVMLKHGDREAGGRILSTIVLSGLAVSATGILQMLVFYMLGFDIFPKNVFDPTERQGSAFVGIDFLRISGLATEPKVLGQFALFSATVLLLFGKFLGWGTVARRSVLIFLLISGLLTASASAIAVLALGVGIGILFFFYRMKPGRIFFLGVVFCSPAAVMALFYVSAINDPDVFSVRFSGETTLERILERSVLRSGLDDSDALFVVAVQDFPSSVLLGNGLGLSHAFVYDVMPEHIYRNFGDNVIPEKSGVVFLFGSLGLFGSLLLGAFFFGLRPELKSVPRRLASASAAVFVYAFLAFLLRIYVIEFSLLSIVAVLLVTAGTGDSVRAGVGNRE